MRSKTAYDRIRFEGFRADFGSGELFYEGRKVPLQEQPFQVLWILLENSGQLVTREELRSQLWPADTFVDFDHNLNKAVAKLREALGNAGAKSPLIETLTRRGYRFIGEIEVIPPVLDELAIAPKETSSANQPTSEGALDRPRDSESTTAHDHGRSMPDGRRAKWVLAAVMATGVLIAVAWIGYRSVKDHKETARPNSAKHSPTSPVRVFQLTNLSGNVSWPTFSPDGRQIAFVWDGGDHPSRRDLYVQLVGGESQPLRLTHTRSEYVNPPTWSPDGREIGFGRCDDSGGAIYSVSALGGPEHRITDIACPYGYIPPLSWTSDGKFLVLADRCVPDGPVSIVVFSTETGAKRCLVALSKGEELGDGGGVLSPDGQTVAFVRVQSSGAADLYTVPLAGGTPTQLTVDAKINPETGVPMWTADGKFICFTSARSGTERTWRVPVDGGTIEPETIYPSIGALSRDGSRLVYTGPSAFMGSSVWRAELSSDGGTVIGKRQLLPDSALDYGPQPSPDGRQIVFESMRSGHDEIWKSNADGSDPQKLTSLNGSAGSPRWSAEGRWIVFDWLPENQNHRQVLTIDEEGRNLHMVVTGDYNNGVASWSNDGNAIYFASDRSGSFQIWRHELATGREMQITHDGGLACFESFDGKTLYFSKLSGGGIWAMPATGGEAQRVTDALHFGYWGEFAVTENGLYLVDSDAEPGPALMYYSFRTRQLKRIFNLNGPPQAVPWSANLGASRDGRTVLVVLGTFRSSLVMAENLQ